MREGTDGYHRALAPAKRNHPHPRTALHVLTISVPPLTAMPRG